MSKKIADMHLIEVVGDDKVSAYSLPVAAVEDVPRQEWFDLMVECGGHVSCVRSYGGACRDERDCPICALTKERVAWAVERANAPSVVTKELLDWLDKGASEAMRFRELLLKRGVK